MNETAWFGLIATALVAVVLWVAIRPLWRGRSRHTRWGLLALSLAMPALAFGLYAVRGDLGAVGADRTVLSEQLLQEGLPPEGDTARHIEAELRRHLVKQPDDARAWVLLARLEMQGNRFADAAAAFARAVEGNTRASRDAGLWVEYAEAVGMAQGRTLVGEPLRLVEKALALDARHPVALDLAGSAAWEVQNYRAAVDYWQRLLETLSPQTPRHAELQLAIDRAQQRARLSLPPP